MENSKNNIINPFVEPSLSYFEFGNSDQQLNALLPRINLPKDDLGNHKINYGLTSPGTLNNPMECNGLDFMNTSTFDKKEIVFSQCLSKFMNKFQMPQLTFENLLNNLPYTFSALNEQEQKEVINGCNKWHKYTLVLFVPKLPTIPFCTSKKSNGNNFTQQNTRIDRLASCNIDIESVTDQ